MVTAILGLITSTDKGGSASNASHNTATTEESANIRTGRRCACKFFLVCGFQVRKIGFVF